jgi:hypothetical protein
VNLSGLLLGLATLLIIGLGFVWVIRGEYYLGYLWWPYMLGTGILIVSGTMFIQSDWASALLGIFGASLMWGSTELKDQAVRAELGWYPYNTNKKPDPPFAGAIKSWLAPHL